MPGLWAAAAPDQTAQFAVLGYAITSMQTQTYRPARLILLGEAAIWTTLASVWIHEQAASPG
jgi:hypothetical protein